MGAVSDFMFGKIYDLEMENGAGWKKLWEMEEAYHRKDYECAKLEDRVIDLKIEVERLKKLLKEKKSGRKK